MHRKIDAVRHGCGRVVSMAGAVVLTTLLLASSGCNTSPPSDNREDEPLVEPKADSILRAMSKRLKSADHFMVSAERTVERITLDGHKIQFTGLVKTLLIRPSTIRTTFESMNRTYDLSFDGSTLKIWSPEANRYVSQPFSGDVDDLLDSLSLEHNFNVAMLDLLVSNPYESAMGTARSGQYIGVTTIHGRKCHHLAYTTPTLDWQIWIDSEGDPLPRKLVITYREEEFAPQLYLDNIEWDFSQTSWPSFPTIPGDAEKMDLDAFVEAEK